jgi:hypothetical protein
MVSEKDHGCDYKEYSLLGWDVRLIAKYTDF